MQESNVSKDSINTYSLKKSHIVITNDFEGEKSMLKNEIDEMSLRVFELDELKIDDAHRVIESASMHSSADKYIAIFAHSYSILAQNALLKLLEEPPRNHYFILYITSKNKLIPTIFSRLVYFDRRVLEPLEPFMLDVTHLNISSVYEFISSIEGQHLCSESGRNLLHSLLDSIAKSEMRVSFEVLKRFDLALKSLYAKQPVHLALLPVLLSIVNEKK